MSSSAIKVEVRAVEVSTTVAALRVRLADGRELSVPLERFPRLREASRTQLEEYRLIGWGVGIHWPNLDEDVSVEGLLATR